MASSRAQGASRLPARCTGAVRCQVSPSDVAAPAALGQDDVYDLVPVLMGRVVASGGARPGLAPGQLAWADGTSYPVYAV